MTRKAVVIFFIITIFFSCSRKEIELPQDVFRQKEMTAILTDIHIAQAAVGNTINIDSSYYTMNDYLNNILKDHKASREKFMNSLKFYSNHPEMLQEVYDSVLTSLSKIEAGLEK
jgi:hypothetical protein